MRQLLVGVSLVVAVGLVACLGSKDGNGGALTSETDCGGSTCGAGMYCISSTPGAIQGPPGEPFCRELSPADADAAVADAADSGDGDGGDAGDGGEVDGGEVDGGAVDAAVDAAPPACGAEEVPCTTRRGSPGCASVERNPPPNRGGGDSCVTELPRGADCQLIPGTSTYRCALQ